MSTVSYKLTLYLFILFIPRFFYQDFSSNISLATFLAVFLILFACTAWQKHLFKRREIKEGGILYAVQANRESMAGYILLILCIEYMMVEIILNIHLFTSVFIMNNLWTINFNMYAVQFLLLISVLVLGYLVFYYGRKNFNTIKLITTVSIMFFIIFVIFTGFSNTYIVSLKEYQNNASLNESIKMAIPLFALFGRWLLLTTIIGNDLSGKKKSIIFNIVNFLLLLVFMAYFFNNLIGHVPYGENTFVAQFFLIGQTVLFILLIKFYVEVAIDLKLISCKKKGNKDITFAIIIIAFFILFSASAMTSEQAVLLDIALIFVIVTYFHFFISRNIQKKRYKIINAIFTLFYFALLVTVANIYIIVPIAIVIICVLFVYDKNTEITYETEHEFFISDLGGNMLRFNYKNPNLITYAGNLRIKTEMDNVAPLLKKIGITNYTLSVKDEYSIKKGSHIIETKKYDYFISADILETDININAIELEPVDEILSYFWENKYNKDYGVVQR